jgi:hypothetical protein
MALHGKAQSFERGLQGFCRFKQHESRVAMHVQFSSRLKLDPWKGPSTGPKHLELCGRDSSVTLVA